MSSYDADVYEQGDLPMEALDPSVADGFRVVYEREVPIEVRHQPQSQPTQTQTQPSSPITTTTTTSTATTPGMFEAIKCKLLLQGPDDSPTALRLELSSEVDLFFSYVHAATEDGYRAIHATQRLLVDFADYPKILVRMMNELLQEPHLHVGVLTLLGDQGDY